MPLIISWDTGSESRIKMCSFGGVASPIVVVNADK
jgi:hypothetical protein